MYTEPSPAQSSTRLSARTLGGNNRETLLITKDGNI
jgi:hypothetical protein